MAKTTKINKAEQYAIDVRDGIILAGELEMKMVQRYFDDLDNQLQRGFVFDRKKATKAVRFFPALLRHGKGKWHGRTFELSPWQAFVVWNLYGWYRADGRRRFNTAYIQVARKNGKSTFASGIGLQMMVADGEHGAEIYVGATKKPQAYITFNEARQMVRSSPALSEFITAYQHNLHSVELNAKFEPLSADSDKQDGLSPYCGIIDEYHAHKTAELFNVLESGMGARTNPLMFVITTAGFNKNGPCYQMRELCIKVLNKVIDQEDLFIAIFEMDKEDDWEDPRNWRKANPSIDDIDTIAPFIQGRLEKVRNDPSKFVDFMTKNLNRWMDADEVWIEDETWMQCGTRPVTLDDFKGVPCYLAIDLSATTDITAVALTAHKAGKQLFLPYFFVPEMTAKERAKKDNVPYDVWIRQGHIIETPGNVVDYTAIRRLISGRYVEDNVLKVDQKALCFQLSIRRCAYDKWNSTQLVNELESDGIRMTDFRQGFGSMSSPTKNFKRMVLKGEMEHGGNPVLRWMISNVQIKKDPAGNEKPDKARSSEKIDGAVACIMAYGEYLTPDSNVPGTGHVRTV